MIENDISTLFRARRYWKNYNGSKCRYLFGKIGKKTLLIDCDLMMASLNYHFGAVGVGITINDYLIDEATPDQIVFNVAENVDAIFASETVGVLFELKDRFVVKMQKLLKYFEDQYDFILVDSPKGIDRTTYSLMSKLTTVF